MSHYYLNPIAFEFLGKPIYWYGIIISFAVFSAYYLAEFEARRQQVKKDTMLDLLLIALPIAFVCARAYYVIFSWDYYSKNTSEIIAIWDGGIAIYGGLIGGLITLLVFAQYKKISPIKLLDIIAPSLLFGQMIGRWGNFVNHEAYGGVVSREYLESLFLPKIIIDNMYIDGQYHHPTFLYESLFCLVAFLIIIMIRNKLLSGEVLATYMLLYGMERFIVEGMREDSLYIGSLRVSQLVSIVLIMLGILYFVYNRFISKKEKIPYKI